MSKTFTGVIQYANGSPTQDVTVRLFDKDMGNEDDDLTAVPTTTANTFSPSIASLNCPNTHR